MESSVNRQTYTDYTSRINAVFDYIEKHIDKDMSLEELAEVACFSKYHFSRIFDAMVGETPFEFIKRVRLEKSASLLRLHPKKTVTQIALQCGFNNLEVFSRNFNNYFEVSPTGWRNDQTPKSNHSQTFDISSGYFGSELNKNQNMEQLQGVKVTDFPELTVAYIRHTGPYKGDADLFNRLFGQLFGWAGPRGLPERPKTDPLAIYHDDPCVTPEEKLRLSICLPVPPDTPVDGEIGKMKVQGGRFVTVR